MDVIRSAWHWVDEHVIPNINYSEKTRDLSVTQRAGEIGINLLVLSGLFVSLLTFPEMTVIGFSAGVYMSEGVRELANRIYTVIRSLNLFFWAELLLMGIVAGPMLFVGIPFALGSYTWWSVGQKDLTNDPSYLK